MNLRKLIEYNRLNINEKDMEFKYHILSIDLFFSGRYEDSYRYAKLTNKIIKSKDLLRCSF